ncbi:hypothetical protein BaRGS_00015451 [Batillaria attramentaria]|uniref:Uncharacterized protein n=1 Tax=Batillaria attramentaria TaxID=370345 RepID=A0ABD0L1J2_9CAEN
MPALTGISSDVGRWLSAWAGRRKDYYIAEARMASPRKGQNSVIARLIRPIVVTAVAAVNAGSGDSVSVQLDIGQNCTGNKTVGLRAQTIVSSHACRVSRS